MRKYRVKLRSDAVGTMDHHPVAESYRAAEALAVVWANTSDEHGKYAPWRVCEYSCTEVAA
jgi:hypothetical protein